MVELIWVGKYREGRKVAPSRAALPLRTLEILDRGDRAAGQSAAPHERAGVAGQSGEPHERRDAWLNRLILGDKRHVLPSLLAEFAGKVDLVYIDPPFCTGGTFSVRSRTALPGSPRSELNERPAYSDSWPGGLDGYLQWLHETIVLLHDLLADAGSLYLHLDWRAGYLARSILDEVFGQGSFRNEIVWAYGASGRGAKATASQFPRNHDTLCWYGKSSVVTYHPARIERAIPLSRARSSGFRQDEQGRWFKTAPRGDYTDLSVTTLERQGRIHRTRNGSVRVKYFLRTEGDQVIEERLPGDTWMDIPDAMHLRNGERTGYQTQKPEALLERIVRTSSDPEDLVLDCFAGSGTTAVVAEKLARRWIAGDFSPDAVAITRGRLLSLPEVRPFLVQAASDGGANGAG